jgi:hypothetical protein
VQLSTGKNYASSAIIEDQKGLTTKGYAIPAGTLKPNTTYYWHVRSMENNIGSSWTGTSFTTVQCAADNDCDTRAGQVCTNYVCVNTECRSNSDCSNGQICGGIDGETCVKPQCTSDNDCDTRGGQVCTKNVCVNTECRNNNDCSNGQVCRYDGACVNPSLTAPTNLTAVPKADGSAAFSWTAPSTEPSGTTYLWGYSTSSDSSSIMANAAYTSNLSAALPKGTLKPGTKYYWLVAAISGGKESPPSTTENFTIPGAPVALAAPTGFKVSSITADTAAGKYVLTLEWNKVTGATGYNIKYSLKSGGPYAKIPSSPSTSGTTVTAKFTGVPAGTYYEVVSAVKGSAESSDSTELKLVVPSPTRAPVMAAPTGFKVGPITAAATAGKYDVTLEWNKVTGATGYNIKYSLKTGGPYTKVTSSPTTSATGIVSAKFTDVPAGTYYEVVSAVKGSTESPDSAELTLKVSSSTPSPTPSPAPGAPAAPTGFKTVSIVKDAATAGTYDVLMQWNSVSGAAGYNIKSSLTSGGGANGYTTFKPAKGPTKLGTAVFATFTKVKPDTYYDVVTAVAATGVESLPSAQIKVEIPKTPLSKPLATCGNGIIESGEKCDGNNFGGSTCSGVMGSGYTGNLSCSSSCQLNTAACIAPTPPATCGNGTIDSGENCDGTNLGGATCASLVHGYTGNLSCDSTCQFDTSACLQQEIVTPPATTALSGTTTSSTPEMASSVCYSDSDCSDGQVCQDSSCVQQTTGATSSPTPEMTLSGAITSTTPETTTSADTSSSQAQTGGPASADTPPATVTGVLTYVSDGKVTLVWDAASDNETFVKHYRVYYGTSPQNLDHYADTNDASTTWYVPNLVNGQQYYFAVSAFDSQGMESAALSEAVSGIPVTTAVASAGQVSGQYGSNESNLHYAANVLAPPETTAKTGPELIWFVLGSGGLGGLVRRFRSHKNKK